MSKTELKDLKDKLAAYEKKLAKEMIGYRGIIHENAWSENKHNQVMILKDIVASLKEEIARHEKTPKT